MSTVETIPALRKAIVAFQRNGYTMRGSLLVYRGAGGRIRTEDFAAIWRDEQRKRERGES